MKKALIKTGVLAGVFIACVCIFFRILNPETADLTTEMSDASLPVLYIEQDGLRVDELHGYTEEMEAASMPDSITPLGDDNGLSIEVVYAENASDTITYEVRSGDGSRLLEDGETELEETEEGASAELTFKDLLAEDTGYLLQLDLEVDGETVHYYAKVQQEGECRTMEVVEFANEFHRKTMDEEDYTDLSVYLEPDSSADNTTLQYVDITNSLSQTAWGNLDVQDASEPVCFIQETSEDTSTVLLRSIVTSEDEDGNVFYYNVEETFRVRPGAERMYLLDYERVVEEIYTGAAGSISDSAVSLGICSTDVSYISNSTGTEVCFVQEGELWSYLQDESQLVRVFCFRNEENSVTDARENYGEHEIRITASDETGIDFVVCGYMNSGEHEGEVGISVCRYDQTTNTVEEYLFLSVTVPYQELADSVGVMYLGDNGKFYLQMNETLLAYDLDTLEEEVIIEDFGEGDYVCSDDGRYIAITKEDQAETLYVLDLSDESTREIAAEDGSWIRPLGFMESDCIYGYVTKSGDEDASTAAYKLEIAEISEDGIEVLTTYEKNHYLIKSIRVEDELITLKLVRESNSKKTSTDTIVNRDMEDSTGVTAEIVYEDEKQTQIDLVFAESAEIEKLVTKTPSLILQENDAELSLDISRFSDDSEE